MRDYKYKGWDATGQKGWVYGDLVHNQKVTETGLEPRVMVGGYEVVPDSIGISIGMTDKMGNTIYENDILDVLFVDGSGGRYVVGWNSEQYCYGIMTEEEYFMSNDDSLFESHLITPCMREALIFKVVDNLYSKLNKQ